MLTTTAPGQWVAALCLLLGVACSNVNEQTATCAAPRQTGNVPPELAEASGIAASSRAGEAWVVTDGDAPRLFALDSTGNVRARVTVTGAEKYDWESLAAARCASGVCLYIGDIGDNMRSRETVRVYRVQEPALPAQNARADGFEFRYPDGPHDAEALFVLPDEQLYVVTKGRSEPLSIYRYPGTLTSDSVVTLTLVQQLSPSFVQLPEMVTGAGASPNGHWIVLRTYTAAQLYNLHDGKLQPVLTAPGADLQPLREFQGEGVDLAADGTILLISEKGLDESDAPLGRVACTLSR